MSTHTFGVFDEGLVVKLEELNAKKIIDYARNHLNKEVIIEEGETLTDTIRNLVLYDEFCLGDSWENGIIYHKERYGNDIDGDFESLLTNEYFYDVSVPNDEWVMMCLPRYESLFNKAYDDEEDLVKTMKSLYGQFLENDFDYKKRLVRLVAAAWG